MIKFPIHDLFVRELFYQEGADLRCLPVLSFEDHLLRQFGNAEFISAETGYSSIGNLRDTADEVWALLRGKVTFYWRDERTNSPTFESEYVQMADTPTLLLVPFGVAFSYQVEDGEALMMRFTTEPHFDSHQTLESALKSKER
jgi:hypothetical protein